MIFLYLFMSAVIIVGIYYIVRYIQQHEHALDHLFGTLNERMICIHNFIKNEYYELTKKIEGHENQIRELSRQINNIEQKIEEFNKRPVGRLRKEK